jgi:hypothetical protein
LWIADAYIWDNFIDQFWTNFKNVWNALWKHLTQLIPLIIDQIRKLHDRFQQFYKKHILPNLKYLTYIRIFLAYLKLFHIKIFDRLDKIIGQIQGALFAPFLWMMRIVNLHGAWFNVVLAADLTIQKAIWIRTMTKYQGEMVNMWWAAQTNPVGIPPGGQGFLSSPGAPPGLVVSGAVGLAQVLLAPPMAGAMEGCIDFRQWAKSATGPIKQQVEDAAAVLLQILNL